MFRLSNISIGLKLSMMSGLGIVFVVGLIVGQIMGGASVKSSSDAADVQSDIGRGIMATKASVRGMAMAVKDIRLSRSNDDLQSALKLLESRIKSIHGFIDPMLPKFNNPENRARVEKILPLSEQYAKSAREVGAIKAQIFETQAKQLGADISELDRKQLEIAKGTLVVFAEVERLIEGTDLAATKTREEKMHQAEASMIFADRLGLGLGIMTALILICSAFLGAFTIARPLKALVKPLEDVAGGNFAITVPGTGRKDEVGQIAEAVQLMAQKVSSTIGEIKNSGREVTNASAEISTSTTDLSQRTEEQAASLEETSAAMAQISVTVKKNADNAQQANEFTNGTRAVADRGGQVVAKAVEAMARIEESSRKISDIIGVIDEIARQTNLLALNAAVEAARAGEAGRGFAVVASEVRSLAQRASQAAKDIKDLITNSNGQVKEGVDLVNRAGASLSEIVDSIKKVADIVADITNASMEQASGIEQVNKALAQMDEVTQQNSALVEENAATAKTLEQQAKAMDERIAFFHIDEGGDAAGLALRANVHARSSVVTAPARGPAAAKQHAATSKRAAAASGRRGPVGRIQAAVATAFEDDPDWREF